MDANQPLFGEDMSKASIARKRKIAESLIGQATEYQAGGNWATALAKALQGAVGGYMANKADQSDAARSKAIAAALAGSSTPEDLDRLSVQAEDPQIGQIANARRLSAEHAADNARQDKQFNMNYALNKQNTESEIATRNRPDYAFDSSTGQYYDTHNPQGGMKPMPGYSPAPAYRPPTPDELKQYPGSDYMTKEGPHYPPKSAVTINNGEVGADETLRKEMSKKEAETFAGYDEAGAHAGGLNQDMQVLDEVLKMAPQGPVVGRLQNMFPGVNTAGDAANAIIYKIAPSLRTKGSGSTSDVEYEGFLKGVPNLRNQPGANQLISATIKAKAQLDIQRADIVTKIRTGEMPVNDGRKALAALNRQSILSPEMKGLLAQIKGESGTRTTKSGVTWSIE